MRSLDCSRCCPYCLSTGRLREGSKRAKIRYTLTFSIGVFYFSYFSLRRLFRQPVKQNLRGWNFILVEKLWYRFRVEDCRVDSFVLEVNDKHRPVAVAHVLHAPRCQQKVTVLCYFVLNGYRISEIGIALAEQGLESAAYRRDLHQFRRILADESR